MTPKTKKIIGITSLIAVASIISIVSYKAYQRKVAKKNEKQANTIGPTFGMEIVENYKDPLWVM